MFDCPNRGGGETMKRNVLFSLIIVLMVAMVLPAGLFYLEAEEEPTRPGLQPWKTLENLETLKNFKAVEVENGAVLSFDMKCIRESLTQAKIAQNVSIIYINSSEMVYHLGTFAPTIQKRKKIQSGKEWVYINPQPEPPGAGWESIPLIKKIAKNAAVKGPQIAPVGKAKLVFKNAMGQVKAVVVLN